MNVFLFTGTVRQCLVVATIEKIKAFYVLLYLRMGVMFRVGSGQLEMRYIILLRQKRRK